MGHHNFYEVDKYEETGCLETQAAFILYSKVGEMIGFGFHIQGVAESKRYVEHPPNLAISVSFSFSIAYSRYPLKLYSGLRNALQ